MSNLYDSGPEDLVHCGAETLAVRKKDHYWEQGEEAIITSLCITIAGETFESSLITSLKKKKKTCFSPMSRPCRSQQIYGGASWTPSCPATHQKPCEVSYHLQNLLSIDPHRGRESSAGFFNPTRSQRHWHLANPLLICSLRKFNRDIIKRKETSMASLVWSVFELSLHSRGGSDG